MLPYGNPYGIRAMLVCGYKGNDEQPAAGVLKLTAGVKGNIFAGGGSLLDESRPGFGMWRL